MGVEFFTPNMVMAPCHSARMLAVGDGSGTAAWRRFKIRATGSKSIRWRSARSHRSPAVVYGIKHRLIVAGEMLLRKFVSMEPTP